MCGIAGIFTAGPSSDISGEAIKKMTQALAHRGPDGEGFYFSDDKRLALGHRRLAIIDLSEAAKQPMEYLSRYHITYNGEIYNYIELREELIKKGYSFVSASDTEVLLALYDSKKEKCLEDLDGMFAFVIYDSKEEVLFCARDRFGEKPFYYSTEKNRFVFASEMKGLFAAGIEKKTDHRMLYNYIAWNYISNPADASETFYSGIRQIPPAHCLTVNKKLEVKIKKYWGIDYKKQAKETGFDQSADDIERLISQSVSRRLRSDVAVGSCLSGGLDSSIIVSLISGMNKDKKPQQKTFSARFRDFDRDEGKYMDAVIKSTRVQPHAVYPTADSLLKNIDKIFYHQEEPFLSASIAAQFEVMQLAAENGAKVLLDGQGADEIFGGYDYLVRAYFQELMAKDPKAYKSEWKKYSGNFSLKVERGLKFHTQALFPSAYQKLEKIKKAIRPKNHPEIGKELSLEHSASSFQQAIRSKPDFNYMLHESTFGDSMRQVLRQADRNSMAHSVEVRLPFLSHQLAEYAFALPPSYKIREGWPKYILRKSFENVLPPSIAWRKDKIGFEVPQSAWMGEKKVQEKIRDAKTTLVRERILTEKSLQSNAHDWRYWMAAKLLER